MPATCQTRHPTAATTWAASLGPADIYQRSVDREKHAAACSKKFPKTHKCWEQQQHLHAQVPTNLKLCLY